MLIPITRLPQSQLPFFNFFLPQRTTLPMLSLSSKSYLKRLPTVCSISSANIPTVPSPPPTVRSISSTNLPTITQPPPTSAYVHLPFCRKRCHYCDFPIVALGSTSTSNVDNDSRITNYINLILREIKATRLGFSDQHMPLETVFFGGGTPSLVPPRLVARVLDALRSQFGVSIGAEVSIEMDPGTFDAERLSELVELGVNRVSLGVQAFQDELLRACGRAHGIKEVHEAISIVTECHQIENWSIDLISSLPHQSADMWAETLHCAIEAGPKHVSVYDLQVEQGTKFGQLYTSGEFPLPSENQSAEFYKMASRTLSQAGYNHYEISSYSKPRYECKHNFTYWQNKPFYGFGLGSASYINSVRFSRPRRLKEYGDYVDKLEKRQVEHDVERVDTKEMAMDVVMLSLRTAAGLDLRNFAQHYGNSLAVSLCKALEPYMASGHVVAMNKERTVVSDYILELQLTDDFDISGSSIAYICLSDPEGFLLSNELISVAFGVLSP